VRFLRLISHCKALKAQMIRSVCCVKARLACVSLRVGMRTRWRKMAALKGQLRFTVTCLASCTTDAAKATRFGTQ
jgi:hypothetical protein